MAANVGGFLGLCEICRGFLKRKPRYQLELSYHDTEGGRHSSRFTSATADQMEDLIRLHLPNTRSGMRITIKRTAGSDAGTG